jgi:arginyl-tRNA synthetase
LASDPKKDVVFDWDRVMSMEGNSAPYLQYTYARAQSVLGKSQFPKNNFQINEKFDENEKELLRYFYIFAEKIVESGERYSPAVLAEYLLNLARKYNEFYAKCKIVGEPEEVRRIFLTQVTAKIIKDGLSMLGIETLEKM